MISLLLKKRAKLTAMLWLTILTGAVAADRFVVFQPQADAWKLESITIGYADAEHSCVKLAAANLVADFNAVTGTEPLTSHHSPLTTILIGTVGTNPQIDQWVKKMNSATWKGKTEKYIIKTIGQQLVIAGSDKRGTVYGIYELSRQIGVSPWYYWADVPVEKHTSLYIKKGDYTDGEPFRPLPWSVPQRRGPLSDDMGKEHVRHQLRRSQVL